METELGPVASGWCRVCQGEVTGLTPGTSAALGKGRGTGKKTQGAGGTCRALAQGEYRQGRKR